MRFSFWIGNKHSWAEIRRLAVEAEQAGWDGLWFADHFMPFEGDPTGPVHEVWAVLAALAEVTDKVRLGPMVCGNTYRHPAVLAKQAVTTDHIAEGRLVLGIGAGWQANEHEAFGLEFGTFTDRFERLEEALQVLVAMRDEGSVTLDGDRYRLQAAPLSPPAVGRLPLLIGGGGEKKTLRMVAQYADEWNVWAEPEMMVHKIAVLDGHCASIGRDPSLIQRSAAALLFLCDDEAEADALRERDLGRPALIGTPAQLQEQMAAYADAGVDELIVPDFNLTQAADRDRVLSRFLTEVAAPFRG